MVPKINTMPFITSKRKERRKGGREGRRKGERKEKRKEEKDFGVSLTKCE